MLTRVLGVGVLGVVLMGNAMVASAQNTSMDPYREWERAVTKCRLEIQRVDPDFDAYVPQQLPGRVRMFGSKRQVFEFKKCLDANGQLLTDIPAPSQEK